MADGVVWELDDAVLEDDSGNVIDDCDDCPCDTVETDCNPTRVPELLTITTTFLDTQFGLTLTYGATSGPGGGPGWVYGGADVELCTGVEFRDFVLWCNGGSWAAEFTFTVNGIQFVVTTSAGMTSIVVVDTDPLCLTTTYPDNIFDCGSGDIFFAIGTCDVIPPRCDEPYDETATLSWSYGGASGTVDLEFTSGMDTLTGFSDCLLPGGTHLIRVYFQMTYGTWADDSWTYNFLVARLNASTFVQDSAIFWDNISSPAHAGEVEGWSLSCSPFAFHFEGLNDGGNTSGGSSHTCDGKTYQFATAGTFTATLDVVTP